MTFNQNNSFDTLNQFQIPDGTTNNIVRPQYLFTPTVNKCTWNMSMMPWTLSNPNSGVMEFKGSTSNAKCEESKFNIHCKRKTDTESHIPTKHIITEEKMVAHMNGLSLEEDTDKVYGGKFDESSYNINMSQYNLESKIKNARNITVCEEVRKLHNPDAIIPKALLNRIEKPCTALVLWQPPTNLQNMISPNSDNSNIEEDDAEEYDNNNSLNLDLNNCMDLDL